MARLGWDAGVMEHCTAALRAFWLPAAALMKSGLGRDAPPHGESHVREG